MKLPEFLPKGSSRKLFLVAGFRTAVLLLVATGAGLGLSNDNRKPNEQTYPKSLLATQDPEDIPVSLTDFSNVNNSRRELMDQLKKTNDPLLYTDLMIDFFNRSIEEIIRAYEISDYDDIEKITNNVMSGCTEPDYYVEHERRLGLKSPDDFYGDSDEDFCEVILKGK